MAPSGAHRPARRPRARRQGRFDRLPGQPVQQFPAHVPTLCPLVAAVCCAAAQGDDPFCIVGCRCAFFQRYDVVRLQVPCGDPPFGQAQPAQLVVSLVHFSAGLLPPVGVSRSGLFCAPLGTRWPARAHIATRVHAAAPLAAYLHFFTGFLQVQQPSGPRRMPALTQRGREQTLLSASRSRQTQPVHWRLARAFCLVSLSICCTSKQKEGSRLAVLQILYDTNFST